MAELFLFVLATAGLTNIIVHGKIMDVIGVRQLLKSSLPPHVFSVFECYECTGFWAGMLCGASLISSQPWICIPCGFAGSFICKFVTDINYLILSKTDFVVGDDEAE